MPIELIVAIVALVVALLAVTWAFALARRIRRLTAVRGDLGRMAAAGDFIGVAQSVQVALDELAREDERLRADDAAIAQRLGYTLRHIGIIRFDALPGDVGENSFCISLLDDHVSGFVLTSMYGRGAYRLYAKPISEGAAELVLTEEEVRSCAKALAGTGLVVVNERRPRRSDV
jgi:hypothetical protein